MGESVESEWDVIVIGAGAAGMMAAARSAAAGARTLMLEKNRKAGVKILMSGGTRCNLTHDCDVAGIMRAFGKQGRFLRQALDRFGPRDTVEMFRQLGVPTKVEETGKVFPVSDRALDARDALLRQARESGAALWLDAGVVGLQRDGDRWVVATESVAVRCQSVIVTVGGKSWPGCGTTGDGYGWLKQLGHTIVDPRPALVPLRGGAEWMRALSGLTLDDVTARVWVAEGKEGTPVRFGKRPTVERTSSFLFTHFGFSGPVVMDVSGAITRAGRVELTRLECDWLPSVSVVDLERWMESGRQEQGNQHVVGALSRLVPRRLAEAICELTGTTGKPLAELSRASWQGIQGLLKKCELPVVGTRGFEKAEVTAGGIALSEVDPRTMASKLVPGLYIAGEILDLDGWIGGYNFQSAFSTGHVAGESAAGQLG